MGHPAVTLHLPASFLLLLLTCVQVCLAMLLGSDYTEGVSGIGVVNALEVVSAWPDGLTGLAGFKQWMDSPDERILAAATAALRGAQGTSGSSPRQAGGKRARSSRGRGSRGGCEAAGRGRGRTRGRRGGRRGRGRKAAAAESSCSSSSGEEEGESGHEEALAAPDGEADAAGAGGTEQGARGGSSKQGGEGEGAEQGGGDTLAQRRFKSTHRGVSRSWNLPAHFPSNRVHEAYLRPLVDHNPAKLGFGRPDGALLTQFCR